MKNIALICLLFLATTGHAQKFDWVKFYQGKSAQQLSSTSTDKNGNVYLAINYHQEIKVDTFTITGIRSYSRVYVSKVDSAGTILWQDYIKSVNLTNLHSLGTILSKSGEYFVFVHARSSTAIVYKGDTIHPNNLGGARIFMLEFSSNGTLLDGRQVFTGDLKQTSYINKNFTADQDDNFYISLNSAGTIKVHDSTGTTTLPSGKHNHILKFSNSGEVLVWAKSIPSSIITNNISCDINGTVYLGGYWEGTPSSFTFKKNTISRPQNVSGCVFIFDSTGSDQNWFHIESSGGESTVSAVVAHDSNSVYVNGFFKGDSAKFDQTWKKSTSNFVYNFIARYHKDGALVWEKHQDSSGATSYPKHNDYASTINFKDQYIYVSHQVYERQLPILYDGISYMGPRGKFSQYEYWGMSLKLDNWGHILWGYRTYYPFTAMGIDSSSNLYFSGWFFNDSIFFGPYSAKGQDGDAFIGKTFDYSIVRGQIHESPYCAGDTIKIPFEKYGEYADSNVFHAELSDENGEFNGRQHRLGSIKSKNSGTIKGVLPAFQVKSSPNYRIRILSTHPSVQSFYRLDTLKLLIFSKDSADAGPVESICRGDSIKLSTYGGTKWEWSPKYNMDDSNLRSPTVWPTKDTVYRIVISDSSGCGIADTAYKQILIRSSPKATFLFSDTSMCRKGELDIPVHFSQGDSLYHWNWYFGTNPKTWIHLKSGNLKLGDTFTYARKGGGGTLDKLTLVLKDECSNLPDIRTLNLSISPEAKIAGSFSDTTVCYGQKITFNAQSSTASSSDSWLWTDLISQEVMSINSTLDFIAKKTANIQLEFRNGCSIDTALFKIKVKNPIAAQASLSDSVFCFNERLSVRGSATGGDSGNYMYDWYLDSSFLSNQKDFTLLSSDNFDREGSFKTIKLIVSDLCSPADTIKTRLKSLPSPKANFVSTHTCEGNSVHFTFNGIDPDSAANTLFLWDLNKEDTSNLKNPSKLFSGNGVKQIELHTILGQCSDTIIKSIEIHALPDVNFTVADVCADTAAEFNNLSSNDKETTYKWFFGDASSDTAFEPKHLYSVGTQTQTFVATLVATSDEKCSDSMSKSVTVSALPSAAFKATSSGLNLFLVAEELNASKYHWSYGDGTEVDGGRLQNYSYASYPDQPVQVCLRITNEAGCTSDSCVEMKIVIGVSNPNATAPLVIYPVPNNGNFGIESDHDGICKIEIQNFLGQVVFDKSFENVPKNVRTDLGKGVYLVTVTINDLIYNSKILIAE